MIAALLSHLWTSTIVLLLAFTIARFAPRLTARTRYAVLLAGVAKFAIPSAAFAPIAKLVTGARGGSVLMMRLVRGPIVAPVVATGSAAPRWPLILGVVWASIAALVLLRALLLHRRTLAAALFGAVPASAREVAALDRAKKRIGVRHSIDVVRSPIAEAPAVLRIVRPVLVLPASSDALEDGELEAILAHECAHVARRDNAVSLFESIAGAMLWFHPLVIVARRELARRREQACDEAVADANEGGDVYVSALAKVCHAAIAPRVAGVSCMASSLLKERMEHFMNYSQLKRRSLSHPVVVAVAVFVITAFTAGTAIVTAADSGADKQRYKLTYSVAPRGTQQVVITATIIDTNDGTVVTSPHITTQWNVPVSIRTDADAKGREFHSQFEVTAHDVPQATLEVTENGVVVQRSVVTSKELSPAVADSKFTGEKISINVKDADVHDMFKVLGQMTGYTFMLEASVTGGVTLNVVEMPWDQALDQICRENNLKYRVEGKTFYITK